MKYDFTSVIDRTGKDSIAWENIPVPNAEIAEGFDRIPMWVADMNFQTAPSVCEAITKRLEHQVFGYFDPSEDYYNSIINWQKVRNGVEGLTKEAIGYENGVLGGVVAALQAFSAPGEAILVHSPTYTGFTSVLNNNGRRAVHTELKRDAEGIWRMDYEDMEAKIRKYHIHAAIMCSPHNPTGRVWEQWELEKAMAVYEQYAVTVISDEIWSDILLDGQKHIPTQQVNDYAREHTVALYAPSKTFNLAGLIGSYHIIYNEALRDRVEARGSKSHYNEMNVLSMHALIGAYKQEGYEWVDELCQVLTENVRFACDYIAAHFKGVTVSKPQGTYMLFLDCTQWCEDHGQSMDELLQAGWDVGVGWQDGRPFHGEHHIRMNLALPKCRVTEAFERLDRYVFG